MPVFISQKKFEIEVSKRASEVCDQIASEIGAEIHDNLVQKLSVFRLYIDRIERSSSEPMEIQALAIKMKAEFEHVIQVTRSLSRRFLYTTTEVEPLTNLLETLCQNMEQAGVGNIHFEHMGPETRLKNNVKMHLVRIVQELIHNAIKHSSAWHIWVRLKSEPNHLVIEVEDDGTGITKISEFINRLKQKNNTLKMRTNAIEATLDYLQGTRGLLVKISLTTINSL